MAYERVNGAWPEGTNDGRNIKPTPQEALIGFRRLWRKAFGKPYKGKLILASGNRRTWYGSKSGTIRVNPDERGSGGWHEIVHSVSHMAAYSLYKEAHGHRHAFIERELIDYVVKSGWLEGKLLRAKKPKPQIDKKEQRLASINARIKRWESKRKRAETALKNLRKQQRYYQRQLVKGSPLTGPAVSDDAAQ